MATHPDFQREIHPAGRVLFREGDRGDAAYLIDSGCVEITRMSAGVEQRLELLSRHELFGELALIDGQPRSASARTLAPTVLVRIDRECFDATLRSSDPMVRHLLGVLLARLRRERAHGAEGIGDGLPAAPAQALVQAREPDVPWHSLMLASELSAAIDTGQLELHYQPIVHLRTRKVGGCEALVRWWHPRRGQLGPDQFVPLAERSGLSRRLGRWVLARALDDWPRLRRHCSPGAGTLPVLSVNLSATEFSDPGVGPEILGTLAARGVDPRELRIELTETAAIAHPDVAASTASSLRAAGVGIALDDFGTGHAGLSSLQALPFSCLKIDREFVRHLTESGRSREIVRASIELARPLGLGIVAEGIEDEATSALLDSMGCDQGQGYLYGRPVRLQHFPGPVWSAQVPLTGKRRVGKRPSGPVRLAAPHLPGPPC